MGIHNVALMPLSMLEGTGYVDGKKAIDNNYATYAHQYSSTGALLVYNCDASSLQTLLNKGATINAVRAKIYMSGGTSHSIRLVTDITSTSNYK